jgi:penicillin-binding protein 1C
MRRRYSLLLLGLGVCLVSLAVAFDRWVDRTELPTRLSETSVEVRDRSGALMRAFPVSGGAIRLPVSPQLVDPRFIDMLVRYEDKRFWSHAGVDPLALLRAAGQAALNGEVISGGSTLTMQVARLLEDGTTGRWAGKLRQIRLALALERQLSKAEILELYLLHAPYGGNLEGIRAAALAWFGREPARLTVSQSAFLVALPQAPERRRPDRNPTQARSARDRVVERLSDYGLLGPDAAQAALAAPVPDRMQPFPQLAPHLADELRAAASSRRRFDVTLDAGVQQRLQSLAAQTVRSELDRLSIAILVADHQTGDVIARVGSAGYRAGRHQGFVDMVRAVRSPGSTLKPFVYGMAFDQGLAHPETMIDDAPVAFDGYEPQNFDGYFRGELPVREALKQSLNIPVVKLTREIGPNRLVQVLRRAGAKPKLPGSGAAGLAVALGGVGVSLVDLVQLYTVLAQGGEGPILRQLGTEERGRSARILRGSSAWMVSDILKEVVPPEGAPTRKIAFKTGTSYGHRDAWAIGYDGRHVIGVWLGRPDGTPVPGAFGGDVAAPVLFQAFGRLKPEFEPLPPPPADTLIVGASDLPAPLQRFRSRNAVFDAAGSGPRLVFPPDGAQLPAREDPVFVKLRGGVLPLTVLADGAPVATNVRVREFEIPNPGPGYSTLVVVDADGQSDRAVFKLR